ncbi:hypothetical protein EVG80_15135 [Salmonella enterica subsp. enterica serovar Mississippi]|nr:hypothetical protein [Salmonella enterica subsp. enterica serovar Mississippi]
MVYRAFTPCVDSQIIFTLAIPAAHTDITTDQPQSYPEASRANLFAPQMAHGQFTFTCMHGTNGACLALMRAFRTGTAIGLLPLRCTRSHLQGRIASCAIEAWPVGQFGEGEIFDHDTAC